MMRILFVIDDLASGGAQRQMVTIAVAMQKRGHHVEFFYYSPADFLIAPLKATNIPIHFIPKRSRYSIDVILGLRKLMRDGKFDVVLAFLPTPNFYAIVASLFLSHRPVVIVSERLADATERVHWRLALSRQIYRWAGYLTTNSNFQRMQLLRHHPWLKDRITTIYNGYDLEKFHPGDHEPSDDVLKLLVIGRVVPNKNGFCLIKALVILRDEYKLCPQLDWVGEHFGQHSEELNKEIAAQNLQTQWNWLYQRQDIVDLLHDHHALVHPSYNEGLPNVVCEALACGRPVIVSDLQDNPYLVQQGVSGYLFDWQSPSDLAKMIFDFYNLPVQKRLEMGRMGRQFAEQTLSQDRLTDNYEKLFKELTNKSHP